LKNPSKIGVSAKFSQALQDQSDAAGLREHARQLRELPSQDRLEASFAERDALELEERAAVVLEIPEHQRPPVGVGGELALRGDVASEMPAMVCTVDDPSGVTVEASRQRLEILMDNDCSALALDAAETIQATNSLEKMLAHQMAQAHKLAMSFAKRAGDHSESAYPDCNESQKFHAEEASRAANSSARMMDSFQKGMLALNKIRSGGRQTVLVQHVNVSDGGQAVVTGGAYGQGSTR
jgi:hypothetical protein